MTDVIVRIERLAKRGKLSARTRLDRLVDGRGEVTLGATTGVGAGGTTLRNEHLTVEVDATDGTYSITTTDGLRVVGLGRLVDGGDGGDTYNYSPPKGDVAVDAPTAVRVRVEDAGAVLARAVIETDFDWPSHAIGDERRCTARATDTLPHTVVTTLELRTGEAKTGIDAIRAENWLFHHGDIDTPEGKAIRAQDLHATGVMMVLLNDAILPNLVQTTEGAPAIVHCGPFANIAHGTSSVLAQRMGLHLADYVVNETGFAADLGAEKFFDLVMPMCGHVPAAAAVDAAAANAIRHRRRARD